MNTIDKIKWLLQFADNALIQGHRISEWCGHGPILEQDIALINTSLDHIGQARHFFQYAAELVNTLNKDEQLSLFRSTNFNAKIENNQAITEDDLAYLRDSWDFKNALLVEMPNEDWAYTIARSFFYDHFMFLLFEDMKNATDDKLKAIAEKCSKEVAYHKRWSSEWIIRLGDGTDESRNRIIIALQERWNYTGELFMNTNEDNIITPMFGMKLPSQYYSQWLTAVNHILEEATLPSMDINTYQQRGGRTGLHSEHLGYILTEMQYIQRAYPGMEW